MNTRGTRPVAGQRHAPRVAPEAFDVFLDPMERRNDVHQTVVGRRFREPVNVGI